MLNLSRLTLENGAEIPCRDAALTGVLSDCDFQEENRNPASDKTYEIRYEEGASSILVAQVREAPDIPEADSEADARQHEFNSL